MIFVVDDNVELAECIAKATGREVAIYDNAVAAMAGIDENGAPEMIIMEVMLTGPDGFTLLNELLSYEDTRAVPVVIVSEKDFGEMDLHEYGVVGILSKDTFRPEDVRWYVEQYARRKVG